MVLDPPRSSAPALPPILAAPKSVPRVAPGTVLSSKQQAAAAAPFQRVEAPQRTAAAYVPARHATRPVTAPVSPVTHAQAVSGAHTASQDRAALQRHQAVLALMQIQHELAAKGTAGLDTPHSFGDRGGGGGLLAAITPHVSLADISSALGRAPADIANEGKSLASNLIGLGPGLLQGGEALGAAALHDLGHPSAWGLNVVGGGGVKSGSALGQIAKAMSTTDPVLAALEGKSPSTIAHVALHNPLNTLLDVTGAYGVAGRAAGAAVRAEMLGGRAADVAALSRAPRALAQGARGPILEPQAYSRNLATQAIQKAIESHPGLQSDVFKLTGRSDARLLRKRAIEHNQVINAVRGEVGKAAETAAKKQGLEGAKLVTAVDKAKNAASAMLHDEFVQRNSLGVSKSLRGARALRTRRGLEATDAQIVGAVTKKGVNAGHFPARVMTEGSQAGVDAAHEYHILPGPMVNTLQHYHFPKTIQIGNTELHTTPALEIPHGLPGAGKRLGTPEFTRWFRNSVLPFSTKWVLGNMSEAALRTTLAGALPTDYRLANKVIKEMENQGHFREATYLRAHTLGGAHGAFQERLYQQGARKPSTIAGKTGHKYNETIEKIFSGNRKAEQQFSQAVLGRHMRAKLGELGLNPTSSDAVRALAKEYAKPEVAAQAGRFGRKILGKYDAFAPGTQSFVRHLAPFGPWYANALKFIYKTMPVEHPLLTAGLNAAHNATFAQWIKQHSKNNPSVGKSILGNPFGSLMYAFKTAPSHYQDLGRYLPFGASTGGPLGWATSPIAPQYATPIANYFGKDAFLGNLYAPGALHKMLASGALSKAIKHQVQAGSLDAVLTALSNIVEQEAGPLNQSHRVLADQGATPYNTEKIWDWSPTMKPGTQRGPRNPISGLNRVFNPFFPIITQPKTQKSQASHATHFGSGGFGGGGFRSGGFPSG